MTEGDNKKKLGLSGGTLSLSGKTQAPKLTIAPKGIKVPTSTTSKGKVVVVTKNTRSLKTSKPVVEQHSKLQGGAFGRSLTESERFERIQAIQNA